MSDENFDSAATNEQMPNGSDESAAAAQGADSAPAGDTPAAAPPAKDGVQSRFDELTRNWRQAERDRDHWRDMAMRGQPREPDPAEEERNSKPAAEKVKTLADFEYDEEAYQAYLNDRASAHAVEAARAEIANQRKEEESARRREAFQRRSTEFAKQTADYYDVLRNPEWKNLTLGEEVRDVVAESELGPELVYHLASNMDVARQIARLPSHLAAREVGRIEERLIAARAKAKDANKVSNAPPPPPKVDGAGEAGIKKDPGEQTDEEWFASRRRNNKRK